QVRAGDQPQDRQGARPRNSIIGARPRRRDDRMKRREFIALLGGAAVAWPLAARVQQGERVRLIGILAPVTANAEQQANLAIFAKELQQLGWIDGKNVRIDTRWAEGDAREVRRHASELVALAPDVILATGTAAMESLQRATRTIPIVFSNVADP